MYAALLFMLCFCASFVFIIWRTAWSLDGKQTFLATFMADIWHLLRPHRLKHTHTHIIEVFDLIAISMDTHIYMYICIHKLPSFAVTLNHPHTPHTRNQVELCEINPFRWEIVAGNFGNFLLRQISAIVQLFLQHSNVVTVENQWFLDKCSGNS